MSGLASDTATQIAAAAAPGAPPLADLRAVQHRVRNDLQTVGALWRLARRRSTPDELVDEFPSWLSALAAVYDSVPLTEAADRVPVAALVAALKSRFSQTVPIEAEFTGESCMPSQMAIVGAVAIMALISFSATSAAPDTSVKVRVSGGDNVTRVEAVFTGSSNCAPWPPLGLAVAAEAAGAQFAMGADGDLTVAVVVMPCP